MKINLLGSSLRLGTGRTGNSGAIAALRRYGFSKIFQGHDWIDWTELALSPHQKEEKYLWDPHLKFLEPITLLDCRVADQVHCSLKEGRFPMTLGGDHAIAMGSLAGVMRHTSADSVFVIWIDAHTDINRPDTSPSGNVHGLPLAAAMGFGRKTQEGKDYYPNLFDDDAKISPKQVAIIGARDIDPGEYDLLDQEGIALFSMEECKKQGIQSIADEVVQLVKTSGASHVHLSFDLDGLDPNEASAVFTPVKDGLSLHEGLTLLDKFFSELPIRSADFVEFDPGLEKSKDSDFSLKTAVKVLQGISKGLENQK